MFSNRDELYNDIAAPGDDLFSTLPYSLTALRPTCLEQGYSGVRTARVPPGSGTSFASAIVTAGATILRSNRPDLSAGQIQTILERSAADQTPATGCRRRTDRDAPSGWGKLDIAAAVTWKLSSRPRTATSRTTTPVSSPRAEAPVTEATRHRRLLGRPERRLRRPAEEKGLRAALFGEKGSTSTSSSGTRSAGRRSVAKRASAQAESGSPGREDGHRAPRAGRYFVQVKISDPGAGRYTLQLVRK